MYQSLRFSQKRYPDNSRQEKQRLRLEQNSQDVRCFTDDEFRTYENNAQYGEVMARYARYAHAFAYITDPTAFRLFHKETLLTCYAAQGEPLCQAIISYLASIPDGMMQDSVLEKLTVPEELLRRTMNQTRYDSLCSQYQALMPPAIEPKPALQPIP